MLKIIRKRGVEIIITIIVILNYSIRDDNDWGQVIHADGKGYYGYLPAVFIYHDPRFNFLEANDTKYYGPGSYLDFTVQYEGARIDKYFGGVAILQMPFFLVAHLIAKITGLPADGYSLIYQLFFLVGEISYFYLGLRALKRLLLYFNKNEWVALFVTFLIALATNIFYFATIDASYSHVFSFCAVNMFLLAMYRIFHLQERKYLWLAAFSLGLVLVLRPVNMLILLSLPFIAGSLENFLAGFKLAFKPDRKLLFALLFFCIPVFIQMGIWCWETGHIIIYSYGSERFYFDRPMIGEVLFGFSKGWFVWTPLAFIGILGYFTYLRKNGFAFWTFTGFFFILVYVLSCWYAWDYGWCFGAREFIEFLVFPAIGLALLFGNLSSMLAKYVIAFICLLCLGLNQFQEFQYRHFILLWDNMTAADYWKVFGKTGKRYAGFLWKDVNFKPINIPYFPDSIISEKYYNDFEKAGMWGPNEVRDTVEHHSGKWANYIDSKNIYSATLSKKSDPELFRKDSIVQAFAWVKGDFPEGAQFAVSFYKGPKIVGWHTANIEPFARNYSEWAKCAIQCAFPPASDSINEMKVFIFNENAKEPLYIDDFEVDIIKRKDNKKGVNFKKH